jgi:hypothetical protein
MKTITPKIPDPPMVDSVIAEVRRVKTDLAAQFDFNISAMLEDARARQSESGHDVVDRSMLAELKR